MAHLHALDKVGVLPQNPLYGEDALLRLLHVAARLGKHHHQEVAAVFERLLAGDGARYAAVHVQLAAEFHRWAEQGQRAAGAYHGELVVEVFLGEELGRAGFNLGYAHHEFAGVGKGRFHVVGNGVGQVAEYEVHAEERTGFEPALEAGPPRVVGVVDVARKRAAALLGNVRASVGCAGGNADGVICPEFLFKKCLDDACGVGAAHAAAFEDDADLHGCSFSCGSAAWRICG